ncbi:MAG: 5'-deoxynucleotidase [Oscillospiraceae bacterium]
MSGFFAMLSRIKYINRWGLMRSARTETLSEHSLETAMLVHALTAIANTLGENLNCETAAMIALYHDASEIITGDLPTPIKYKNKSIITAYKTIEGDANRKLISMLPEKLRPQYEDYFFPEEKYGEYIPYIKAADKLSAIIKCLEEKKSGNTEFETARETLLAHPSLQLPAAKIFMEEYLPAYSLTLDKIST